MLEDCTMEKKPVNRSVQPPGKGSTESKKSQDVSNIKQFGRGCRRRETSGSSNTSKNEQYRKPQLQKNKPFDKRPRPRGQNYFCGKEDSQVGETNAEYGSVLTHGSKKHNLNHLLNFHYAPRGIETQLAPRSPAHYTTRWLASTHKHKYNKEQFLQANCQFVVRSSGDYTPYIADPDTLVDWNMVEQIRVLSAEAVKCPICLCVPTAGKMTRCGHVFCWPCILHYLALSDKTWRKCPICYEAVHKKDLKSVLSLPCCQPTTGQTITLQLMKRERGCLVAAPVSQFDARNNNELLSVSEKCLDTVFSKLLLADASEVLNILDNEEEELKEQMTEEEGCPELCFVEQALQLLVERRTLLLTRSKGVAEEEGQFSPAIAHPDVKVEKQTTHPVEKTPMEPMLVDKSLLDNESALGSDPLAQQKEDALEFDCNVNRPRYESQSSEGEDIGTTITAEDLEISELHHTNNPAKHFYFYQAEDGQQVYLHAVNARMLEMSYGSMERCPPLLKGRIVEKEAGSMTEELRRRLRYLQHLPVTCQFEVVEIHLAPPLITADTAEAFRDQLEKRRKRRDRAARDERRREKKIEATQYGHQRPAAKIRIESYHQFPQCGTAIDTQAFQAPIRSLSAESSRTSSPSSVSRCRSTSPLDSAMAALALEQGKQTIPPQPPLVDSDAVSSPPNDGPSFAQMLREGKMKVSHGGGGWGITLPLGATGPQQMAVEDYAFVPRFKQSFSDAIAQAIETAAAHQGGDGEPEMISGKKKKKKQKVLFTTGMACTGK